MCHRWGCGGLPLKSTSCGDTVHLGSKSGTSLFPRGCAVFFEGARDLLALVCISVFAVTAAGGSALTAGHFWKSREPDQPKVTKNALPHHLVPRLGSACLNEGIAPWAAAKGHPWPSAAIPASMPGCPLHNACVRPSWLTGRRDQRPRRGGLTADLVLGDRVSPVGASLLAKAVGQLQGCWAAGLIASKLAPTKELREHTNIVSAEDPMWERACSR